MPKQITASLSGDEKNIYIKHQDARIFKFYHQCYLTILHFLCSVDFVLVSV